MVNSGEYLEVIRAIQVFNVVCETPDYYMFGCFLLLLKINFNKYSIW